MSRPIMITSDTDASLKWCSTPPLWHIDAVGGASTPSFMGASTANAGIAATLGNQQANLQNSNLTNQANLQYGSNVAMGNNQGSADLANNAAAQNALN